MGVAASPAGEDPAPAGARSPPPGWASTPAGATGTPAGQGATPAGEKPAPAGREVLPAGVAGSASGKQRDEASRGAELRQDTYCRVRRVAALRILNKQIEELQGRANQVPTLFSLAHDEKNANNDECYDYHLYHPAVGGPVQFLGAQTSLLLGFV